MKALDTALVTLLLSTSISYASPVKVTDIARASTSLQHPSPPFFDRQQAQLDVLVDLERAHISKDSTIDDLIRKVTPLLSGKHANDNVVCRVALNHLQDNLGVSKETMERYRFHRNELSCRISNMKWNDKQREQKKKMKGVFSQDISKSRRRKASKMPLSKIAWNNRRAQQRINENEIELQELSHKIEQAGLQDETDLDVFLKNEDKIQGDLTTKKITQLLGEYMKRTKGIDGWTKEYSKRRNVLKSRESKMRAREARQSASFDVDEQDISDESPLRVQVKSSQPRRHFKTVMSDSDEVEVAVGASLTPSVKGLRVNPWPTKQRSAGRKPKGDLSSISTILTDSRREVLSRESSQTKLSGQKRSSALLRSESEAKLKRPTTGEKSYTAETQINTAIPPVDPLKATRLERPTVAGKSFKGFTQTQERPTTGEKKYTGVKSLSKAPQIAQLAPKKIA